MKKIPIITVDGRRIGNQNKTLKVGDWVEGSLFYASEKGKVIAVGDYDKVKKYDESGAMADAIKYEKLVHPNEKLVAVRFPKGDTAVYVANEIWKVKK